MIYKFKSKAAGDVIMLGPNGDHLLRLLGREPAPKGIIEPADMPGAIAALQAAVQAEEAARAQEQQDALAAGQAPPSREGQITLRQRVWPMVDMLKRCAHEGHPIVWGV